MDAQGRQDTVRRHLNFHRYRVVTVIIPMRIARKIGYLWEKKKRQGSIMYDQIKKKFVYICQWCGKRAFVTDVKVKKEQTVFDDPIVCQICKKVLPILFVENFVDNGRINL